MKEVTDENFKEVVLDSKKPIIVDFWAEWCGPCRYVAPILEELSIEFANDIEIVKCNVDNNPITSREYNIRSIPSVMFFKNREPKDWQIGATSKAKYIEKINKFLS